MYIFIISIRLTQLVFLDTKLEIQANILYVKQNQLICPIFLVGQEHFSVELHFHSFTLHTIFYDFTVHQFLTLCGVYYFFYRIDVYKNSYIREKQNIRPHSFEGRTG